MVCFFTVKEHTQGPKKLRLNPKGESETSSRFDSGINFWIKIQILIPLKG